MTNATNFSEYVKNITVLVIGFALGISLAGIVSNIKSEAEKEKIRRMEIELNELKLIYKADLDGNGLPEEFKEYGGRKYFAVIDGKTLEDKFRK